MTHCPLPTRARLMLFLAAGLLSLPSSARADWMVGAFAGHAWTLSSTAELSLPDRQTQIELVDLQYRGQSFQSPQYYGLRIAWFPDGRQRIGVEAEWIHAKVYAKTERMVQVRGTLQGAPVNASLPLSSIVQRLSMSHGLNFILANLVVRRELGPADPQGGRRFALAVRAGAGPTLPHAESTVFGVTRFQYESGGLGAQAAGGLDVTVWRGLGVLGEYKFTWTTSRIDVSDGQATIPARSHHLVAGVAYRF